jgi:hypothetical protein
MYQAIHADASVLESGRRLVDRDWFIRDLYVTGEPFEAFFASNVATLPPPQ